MASRQLLCMDCKPKMERIARHPEVVAAGETVRFVVGASLGSYVCDDCTAALDPGARCAATTILSAGEQLGPWEHGYVEPSA